MDNGKLILSPPLFFVRSFQPASFIFFFCLICSSFVLLNHNHVCPYTLTHTHTHSHIHAHMHLQTHTMLSLSRTVVSSRIMRRWPMYFEPNMSLPRYNSILAVLFLFFFLFFSFSFLPPPPFSLFFSLFLLFLFILSNNLCSSP